MTILQIITRSDLGGAQSVVTNLVNYFSADNNVIVAAGSGDEKMWQSLNKNVKCVHIKRMKRELSIVDDILTLFSLYQLNRRYKPDIIHLHSSKAGFLGRLVLPKAKIVYTVHGFDSIRVAYRKFLPIERILQKNCSAIVGVSEYDKNNMLSERINCNVSTVYNGIVRPFSLKKDPFDFCKQYKARILCIARLSPQKNSDLFWEIASLLPQYAFIWIGNQTEVTTKLPYNVFFMGNIPNAGAYNEYADLFILPSNYEGLPMVILEAMSYGKPIVASDVGGISEIVENGKNGYVVENSAKAFADKIEYIIENKEINILFSTNSLKRFERELTVDNMANGYMKIYRSISKKL